MIDTHAHLDFEDFDEDREEVISRAFDNGVKAIINVGVDLERSRKSVEIAEKHERVFASVGLHPDFFSKGDWGNQGDWENIFGELKSLADHKKVVAVGETGLDYFRAGESGEIGETRERQKKGFIAQINLAEELGLPVIVHCRNSADKADGADIKSAWEDLYGIVSRYEFRVLRFVLHCYSGEKKDTEKFLKLPNVSFSFSGNITFPKPIERAEKLAEAVKIIPLERMMLDSDSPLLAPQDLRGKRNEPINVLYIAKKIAELKDIDENEVEKVTDENTRSFFGISLRTMN